MGPGPDEKNLVELLLSRVRESHTPAAEHKTAKGWEEVSWAWVLDEVKRLSDALVGWGVKPGDRVAILAGTTLQWVVTDLAISAARAITVPIYASNTPDEIRHVLQNSGACLLFVDHDLPDAKQPGRLSRVRQKLAECPECKQVVLFEAAGALVGREIALGALLEKAPLGAGFEARVAAVQPSDLCHFLYTSGTTGDPKGVMLTHGNWAYEAKTCAKVGLMLHDDSVMLFLPLAHSFAQVIKACWLGMGFKLVFAESIDTLISNLAEARPSILPAVPRVFEKVFAGVQSNAMGVPGVKGRLGRWAFRLFDEYVEARQAGRAYDSLGWALAKRLVFSKVKAGLSQKLGGRMRLFISGGAPLSKKIAYFFDLLGFEVLEGFGLTETSAASCVNRPGEVKIGTVGPPIPGTEVKIASDGEILLRGPGVMKGYYNNEAATAEVLEKDGWFHTGDIGEIDAAGFVRITDRKKDIIVTAGGKNVAPQNLENTLKTYPIVSTAMVHGDKRPYLTVLICVNEDNAQKLLTAPAETYAALAARPEIRAAVQKVISQVNSEQPPYNTLKKFHLMDHEFTQETGELTPTLKVKRKLCTGRYLGLLDAMYDAKER